MRTRITAPTRAIAHRMAATQYGDTVTRVQSVASARVAERQPVGSQALVAEEDRC